MSRITKSLLFLAIVLALFTVSRAILYGLYPDTFGQLSLADTASAFLNGLRFDGSVVARLFLIPLLLMTLPWRRLDSRRWFDPFAWLLYLLTIALFLLLMADVVYFKHVGRHIAYELTMMGGDAGFVWDFIRAGYWVEFLAYLALCAGLAWLWWRILRIPLQAPRWQGARFAVLFLALAVVGRGGVTGKVIEIVDAYSTGDAAYGHLSLNGAFSAMVFALNLEPVKHQFFPAEEAQAIVAELRPPIDADYPLLARYADNQPSGYNVVVVLLESWNFKHVDSFGGNGYGATPYFDQLAAGGLRYTRFYAAGQRSIDGIQAVLTGIPVLKGLPRIDTGIGVSNFTRLGALAREQGYHTLFVQSSDRDSFKVNGIANAAGFEAFYGREDMPLLLDYADPAASSFGWDHETLQFLKQRLDEVDGPFLAYVYTGTTHEPYAELPEQFHIRPHDPDGEEGFLNTLHYADWSIGQFMAAARQAPWFDNTVFVFTADHANGLQRDTFAETFHIPMLIYAPGIIAPGERAAVTSQLDVMPTVIDLLGLDAEYAALGQSLLRPGSGQAFTSVGGQGIGLISDEGYVSHNLSRRMAQGGWGKEVGEVLFERLERRLLALDQVVFRLLQDNRWARQGSMQVTR